MSFIRKNEVDISKYLPKFLFSDLNIKAVATANSLEHEKIRINLEDILNQFFVDTATWGLDLYEKELGIVSSSKESYEYRRKQIKLKIAGYGTSTAKFMNQIINTYGSGYIEEHNDKYYFKVYTTVRGEDDLKKLKNDICIFKPAHLDFSIYVGISWNGLKRFDGTQSFGTYTIENN